MGLGTGHCSLISHQPCRAQGLGHGLGRGDDSRIDRGAQRIWTVCKQWEGQRRSICLSMRQPSAVSSSSLFFPSELNNTPSSASPVIRGRAGCPSGMLAGLRVVCWKKVFSRPSVTCGRLNWHPQRTRELPHLHSYPFLIDVHWGMRSFACESWKLTLRGGNVLGSGGNDKYLIDLFLKNSFISSDFKNIKEVPGWFLWVLIPGNCIWKH